MNETTNKSNACPNDNMPEGFWDNKPKRDCDLANPEATIRNNNGETVATESGVLSK